MRGNFRMFPAAALVVALSGRLVPVQAIGSFAGVPFAHYSIATQQIVFPSLGLSALFLDKSEPFFELSLQRVVRTRLNGYDSTRWHAYLERRLRRSVSGQRFSRQVGGGNFAPTELV